MTTNQLAPPILDQDAWRVLRDSHAAYKSEVSTHYDEVLQEVSARIGISASIGKTDIGALLFWKRLRAHTPWVGKLMMMPDKDVRAVTEKAVFAVNSFAMTTPMAASAGREAGHCRLCLDSNPVMRLHQPCCWQRLPNAWQSMIDAQWLP